MNTKIIDGKKIAEEIKDKIIQEIIGFNDQNPIGPQASNGVNFSNIIKRPNLAIILIGDREDSKLYVNLKEKQAKTIGIDTHIYKCPDNTPEIEILKTIRYLNKDKTINGILVQLPLPKNLNANNIIKAIDPAKDVDRFHPDNLSKIEKWEEKQECDFGDFRSRTPVFYNNNQIISPVFGVILEIFKKINYNIKNKTVCIISNSNIFGKNLAQILKNKQAKIQTSHVNDKNLINKTQKADVLITAVGRPKFIKKEMIKKDVIIIDIGITKIDNKIYGDVDFDDVKNKASYITPVPGGVGPITIALLFKNTLELYKQQRVTWNA
ncbi:bifunctional 5,10-methylenetetrahydrofolate dehydrogenase/5,10-methenyltetrahydrofolate cyclohydrolase [Patescibacteria group bacterium]|nr:bifunctional 5,10-methylenetetrahydrofolate dehydrogenase/5,10-methenyltetrahydrofolate cyclohydrolase [Patescibacteria group bacterium]MBU2415978.1 bifunctional 5,10-methylenetetrahydrofolate dehydrogenase/5,10-methenyltetrahydrofolate cyclohydrolase [Patescibacteria group bacterium]